MPGKTTTLVLILTSAQPSSGCRKSEKSASNQPERSGGMGV